MGIQVHTRKLIEPLSKRLEDVDEAQVLHQWFGVDSIPCVISSPFRDDSMPSFSLRYSKNGHIYGHDFATGEHFSVTDMVMKAEKVDFKTAASMILDGKYSNFVRDTTLDKPKPSCSSEIDVVLRPLNDQDEAFWSSFGISPRWMEFGGIYPISDFVVRNGDRVCEMAAEEYAYAFITFFNGRRHTKIYQPFSKSRKWRNDGDGVTQVWNLLDKLPKEGEAVIITSSLKDALCLWAQSEIPACCPQSESVNLNENIVEDLRRRFKRVFVFFDNDFKKPNNLGQTAAKKQCERFGLENIMIDAWWGCKDPSDLYKKHGKETLLRILKNHNL